MSDGSLSQDEIDALLMGGSVDDMPSADSGDSFSSGSGALSDSELQGLKSLLIEASGPQGNTLSGIMVSSVEVSLEDIHTATRDSLMGELPDEVVEISIAFKDGVSGDHLYILNPEDALKIAGPMIGQDDLELNGTAVSAVSEAMSQISGAAVTAIGDSVGKTILTQSPEGQSAPKAMLGLPGDEFVQAKYSINIEGQGMVTLYEIFQNETVSQLVTSSGGSSASPSSDMGMGGMDMGMDNSMGGGMGAPQQDMMGGGMQQPMGGMGMPQQNMMGGMQQPMGGMGMPQQNMMGGMQQPMGGMGMGMPQQNMMGGMGMPMGGMNVQGVQFPDFQSGGGPGEQRNISLLMDVSMELTVELGRTRWQIKDILGMGEGTIVELDKLAGEPVDILVNNNLIARGEVVVIDENFGVRVTEIISTVDRMGDS